MCNGLINLSAPLSGGWEGRGFGRRYLWRYACPVCGHVVKVRACAYRGKRPEPGVGAIRCPNVEPRYPLVPRPPAPLACTLSLGRGR